LNLPDATPKSRIATTLQLLNYAALHVTYADTPYQISISSGSLLIDINFVIYFHFPILT
jgi:hypothetical protein